MVGSRGIRSNVLPRTTAQVAAVLVAVVVNAVRSLFLPPSVAIGAARCMAAAAAATVAATKTAAVVVLVHCCHVLVQTVVHFLHKAVVIFRD